jgi:uncharacterized RDD family membrane protein YckC
MSNTPPPPPPGGGFPPPTPPDGAGFPPPTPPGGGGFGAPAGQPGGFAGYAPTPGDRQLAGFWARFAALIIDGLITAVFLVPGYIYLLTGPTKIDNCPDTSEFDPDQLCTVPTGGTWTVAIVLFLLGFAATLVYWGKLEGNSQTVGKRAMGLRVVDVNTGAQIGTGRAIGRYFARILSQFLCFLGYFWMLWDDKSQCWHDKIVSDVVVKEA